MNNSFKYIFFDLDGTLVASALGIVNSFKYALEKMDMTIPTDEILMTFVGPPLDQSFRFCGVDEAEIDRAIELYRENYIPRGMYEAYIFEGIENVLKTLKENGKSLIVTTSKVEHLAEKVLADHNISKYFDFICGSDVELTRNSKAKVIEYAFERANISNRDEVIIVGDTKYDIIGAKETGIKSIGVLYGYGSNDELKDADYIAEKSSDILSILL
ncbi:MAG: HAD-IA family hydrolase [Tyzzerella sp.]|uniref:HAD-IA family hydrolase n=1 Tax=Candidatus Fimicola merdigallinarum TaxID=2840819 RepID=A0A9D9DUD8_9FIRM|nr:HAD-IA family hydrolase [Candidatus Fimicola merdigallinarum]